MVYIEIAQPERLKPTSLSKLSAFVSFEYDSNLVSIIKSMGTRVYISGQEDMGNTRIRRTNAHEQATRL